PVGPGARATPPGRDRRELLPTRLAVRPGTHANPTAAPGRGAPGAVRAANQSVRARTSGDPPRNKVVSYRHNQDQSRARTCGLFAEGLRFLGGAAAIIRWLRRTSYAPAQGRQLVLWSLVPGRHVTVFAERSLPHMAAQDVANWFGKPCQAFLRFIRFYTPPPGSRHDQTEQPPGRQFDLAEVRGFPLPGDFQELPGSRFGPHLQQEGDQMLTARFPPLCRSQIGRDGGARPERLQGFIQRGVISGLQPDPGHLLAEIDRARTILIRCEVIRYLTGDRHQV